MTLLQAGTELLRSLPRRALACCLLCCSLLLSPAITVSAQDQGKALTSVSGGSDNVSIGGRAAARQGDASAGAGVIAEGAQGVFINGKPAAVVGSRTNCGGLVIGGDNHVFINGKPAARAGDLTSGCPAGK